MVKSRTCDVAQGEREAIFIFPQMQMYKVSIRNLIGNAIMLRFAIKTISLNLEKRGQNRIQVYCTDVTMTKENIEVENKFRETIT